MCSSEKCILIFFGLVILGFAVFILLLLRWRSRLLREDSALRSRDLLQILKTAVVKSQSPQGIALADQSNFLYSIWQDFKLPTAVLIFKDLNEQVVARMYFASGAREYQIEIENRIYKAQVNLTWGGTNISLIDAAGAELCTLSQKSFALLRHTFVIPSLGSYEASLNAFDFSRRLISFQRDGQVKAYTAYISPWRRIGRVAVFDREIPLPVQVFILGLSS